MKRLAVIFLIFAMLASCIGQLVPSGWPKYRSGGLNSGFSSGQEVSNQVKWLYLTGSAIKDTSRSPVVDVNGNVIFMSTDGNLYCLTGANGGKVWIAAVGAAYSSVPSVGKTGYVYVGNDSGVLFAFNKLTGDKVWSITLSSAGPQPLGPPSIGSDGTVYVECDDGHLYAVDGVTGGIKWSLALDASAVGVAAISCPAIGNDGTIYLGGSNYLYAVTSQGKVIWSSFQAPPANSTLNAFSTPSIGPDGTIYAIYGVTGNFGQDGQLVALSGSNGHVLWNHTLGTNSQSPAVSSTGTVYVNSTKGYTEALNANTGQVIWSTYTRAFAYTSVSLSANSTAYVMNGGIVALNGSTGAFICASQVLSQGLSDSAIGSDGSLYVCAYDGSIYAFPGGLVVTSLQVDPSSVAGGAVSRGTVSINSVAPKGGVSIALQSSSTNVLVPATVLVPQGQTSVAFTVATLAVQDAEDATITATLAASTATATITVTPPVIVSIALSPTTVAGGTPANATVTITSQAPANGLSISLASSSVYVQVPASVSIPGGKTSYTFTVTTLPVQSQVSGTVFATLAGTTASASLNLTPPTYTLTSFVINPSTVVAGQSTTGTVTISNPAPTDGILVNLSLNGNYASMPTSVFISKGKTSATFIISTSPVLTTQTPSITASLNTVSLTDTLKITPTLAPILLAMNPSSVVGTVPSTGTVTLNYAAPSGGAVVNLTSDQSGVIVPATVTVAAGSTTATFTAKTPEVVSTFTANIKASLNGFSQNATLTLNPFAITSVIISPSSVTGGTTSTVTINLNGPAPSGGLIVGLSSSSSVISVPGSITIPGGKSSSSFTVTAPAVNVQTSVVISAVLNGVAPQSATLTILPSTLVSVTLTPSSVTGGNVSVGTITLNGQAPLSGLYAQLSTKTAFITIPSTVEILPGNTSATFTVHTGVVSSVGVATITVSVGSITQSVNLTVNPSTVMSISLAPSTVVGGVSSTGTVTLTGPAPKAGVRVKLVSSLKSVTLPASVLVPAQKSSITFAVRTTAVATNSVAVITGSVGTTSVSDDLSITAPTLLSLTLNPTTVVGTHSSTGTVKISSAAPVGGLSITLASNNTNATVLTKVTIPAGRTSATFTVKTKKVTSSQTATISGTLAGQSASAILNIH